MSRQYASIDASQLGPGLVTERANTIVLCDLDGADNQRMAVSLLPQAEYQHDVEVLFWSPIDAGGVVGVGKLYVGISQPGASRSKYVGQQASSFGFRLDDGKVYSNGVAIATFVPVALGAVIRMRVDVAGGVCTWYANEALLGSVPITAGQSWLYAVTVSGGAAGSIHCYCNAGQTALVSPVRSVAGWYQETPQLAPLLLSSDDFLTAPTDSDPNRRFRRVLSGAAVDNTRAVAFWTDGSDGTESGSAGTIDLVDPSRQLIPVLMAHDIRDHAVSIEQLEEGAPLSEAVSIASGVVDGIERTGDSLGRISLRDPSVELGVPLQPRLVLPNADPAAVDTAWPVLFGAARSASLKLIDATLRRYAVAHQSLAGIATVRCNGKPLDPNATIPDYTLSLDGTCIDLREDLQGRITLDVTAQGQYVPGSGVDMLGGHGDFSALTTTPQLAVHWNRGGSLAQGGASNAAFFPRIRAFMGSPSHVEFPGSATSYNSQSWIVWPTAICQPGRVYRARLYITYLPGINSDGRQSYLALCGMPSVYGPMYEWHRFVNNGLQITGEWQTGWYEFVFRNSAPTALPFALHHFGAVNGETAVRTVELYELPSATTVPELDGIPLATYISDVLALARCRPDLCDIASAEAIDAETGFLYGTQIMDTTTAADAINLALRSCGATIAQRRDGGFSFVRFLDPDDVDEEALGFEITESMLLSEPRQWLDPAEGLTTSAVGGRNIEQYSDADFGDDFDVGTGVPMSIRRMLTAPYRWRVSSAIQLAGCYRHALSADPLETIFDRAEHGLAALDHMLRPYRVPRWFSSIEIARPRGRVLDVGRVHRFTYPAWYYDGRKVHIRAVGDTDATTTTLTIWSR